MEGKELIPIQDMIYEIRGVKVMLDRNLAELYEVSVSRLNEAVKRNIKRFPEEFMFQLTEDEWQKQRSHIAIFNKDTRKYKPYAFTEHGILMLSSVLSSDKAIEVNIKIMKIFVELRKFALSQLGTNEQIKQIHKLLMLHIENSDNKFSKHDEAISQIAKVLNNLIEKPKETKRIGFST